MIFFHTVGHLILHIAVHAHLATIFCRLAMEASWDAGNSCSMFISGRDWKCFENPGKNIINILITHYRSLKMCWCVWYYSIITVLSKAFHLNETGAPGRYKTKTKLFNQKFALTVAGCQDGNHYSWMQRCKWRLQPWFILQMVVWKEKGPEVDCD